MKPPTNRLQQTIATLGLVRETKGAPIVRWLILLFMADHKHDDGSSKPITMVELSDLTGGSSQCTPIRQLVIDGLVEAIDPRALTHDYVLTDAGRLEVARIIHGKSAIDCHAAPPKAPLLPDMTKVHAFVGTPNRARA